MDKDRISDLVVSRVAKVIFLMAFFLSACGSPAPVETSEPATPIPPADTPAVVLPTSTSTLEPPVPVTSLEEIVGVWVTHCGGGPCTVEFRPDGTYRQRYIKPTEGQGVTSIDSGKITFADGIFTIESTAGYCKDYDPGNGFYQATLAFMDGKPYELVLLPTERDPCDGRYQSWQFPLHPYVY